jgi:hypothetical protein
MTSQDMENKPTDVIALEAIYAAPRQAGFGSAVFFDPTNTEGAEPDLEPGARAKYKHFCGEIWQRFGEANWLATWKEVYLRNSATKRDVVAELRSLSDSDVRSSTTMILDVTDSPAKAHHALADAFDAPHVTELRVYRMRDGEAMSGLLFAARRPPKGTLFLAYLMD